MAFTFLKAQGYEIGNSLVENNLLDEARTIMIKARKMGVKFYLPVDVVISPEFSGGLCIKYVPAQEDTKRVDGVRYWGQPHQRPFREVYIGWPKLIWLGWGHMGGH